MKKAKVLSIIGVLAIIAAFSGCSSGDSSLVNTSNSEVKEPTIATTAAPQTALLSNIDTYTIEGMKIDVPQAWSKSEKKPNYYFYDKHGDMLYIHTDNLESLGFGDLFFESFKKGIKDETENYVEKSSEKTQIADRLGYHFIYTSTLDGEKHYANVYVCFFEDRLYSVYFSRKGDKQCSDFNETEQDIISSIKFEYSSANQEEKQTTAEKTTEKPTEKATEKPTEAVSREYQNALKSAQSYLEYSAFSKEGLYEQLLYEKYPENASRYAVDNVKADWKEQAVKCAQSYLEYSAFSKEDLYDQLVYEKFTEEQARYAVNKVY